MAEEARAIRADIADTRTELGETVQALSARLAPRQQAEQAIAARRDAVLQRVRALSSEDLGAVAARVRTAVEQRPRAAAGLGAVAVLLVRRRRRRR